MSTFSPTELNLSDSATSHFKEMISSRGKGLGIKIGVKKAGCSGYEYTFDFVDEVSDDYICFDKSEVNIYVDPKSIRSLTKILLFSTKLTL